MADIDYYKILGIKRDATTSQIKARYQLLAKKYHPDGGGEDSLMALINEAYQTLSNPAERLKYDQSMENGAGNTSSSSSTPPRPHGSPAPKQPSQSSIHQDTADPRTPASIKHPATFRLIATLYVLAYIILAVVSFLIGISPASDNPPNQQSSYITCADGTKYSYSQIPGFYNPTDDWSGSETTTIDSVCKDAGGNTYTNSYAGNTSFWVVAFWVFGIGMFVIEIAKGALVYITQGYVPNWASMRKKKR